MGKKLKWEWGGDDKTVDQGVFSGGAVCPHLKGGPSPRDLREESLDPSLANKPSVQLNTMMQRMGICLGGSLSGFAVGTKAAASWSPL